MGRFSFAKKGILSFKTIYGLPEDTRSGTNTASSKLWTISSTFSGESASSAVCSDSSADSSGKFISDSPPEPGPAAPSPEPFPADSASEPKDASGISSAAVLPAGTSSCIPGENASPGGKSLQEASMTDSDSNIADVNTDIHLPDFFILCKSPSLSCPNLDKSKPKFCHFAQGFIAKCLT